MSESTITLKPRYVDYYFYACLDELFAVKNSYWKSSLTGNEINEIAEYLNISLDIPHLIKNYWDESSNTIEIFHSEKDDLIFLYFDLRRMFTDQNDMFFLGVRCLNTQKEIVMEKLVQIYSLLNTCGPFHFDKWGFKLFPLNKKYLVLSGDYEEEGKIIHHRI